MAAFVLPLISGLAGLFGGKPKQQTTTTNSTTNTNQQQNSQFENNGQTDVSGLSQTTHNLSPLQQKLSSMFGQGAQDLYSSASDLSGYEGGGLRNINQGADVTNKILQNTLASRGLSFSPAATNAIGQSETARVGKSVDFLNSIPLLQRQLQQQAFGNLLGAFSALPTDSTTATAGTSSTNQSGTSNIQSSGQSTTQGTSTGTQSGNPIAGALGGLGSGLAAPQGNGQGSNLDGISSILSRLFGGG